jgi:hypothetical protein
MDSEPVLAHLRLVTSSSEWHSRHSTCLLVAAAHTNFQLHHTATAIGHEDGRLYIQIT